MKPVLILFSLIALHAGPSFSAEAKRPNLLFILVDDQSPFDLKVYDPNSKLGTPHIDRLAREGMVFDGAYHMGSFTGAVCTPSRHMIMSGRSVWHLPIGPQVRKNGLCPPDLEQQTLPAVFNRAGYATMRTCKEGNSYEGANKLFTVRHDATKRGGTSFKPVLYGTKQTIRDTLYGVYNGGTKPGMRAVKHGDWKLIKYDVMNGSVRETQLFNLKDNPDELLTEHHDPKLLDLTGAKPAQRQVNLAADPEHAAKLAEMEALLLAEMRRLDDPWRLWNQPADGLTPPREKAPGGQGKGGETRERN